jgi:predicted signal transduction protein with EAL and GGDEF domain
VRLAIDDFGTGYSSLAYLHQLPVDELKIDRSFINRIAPGNRDAHLVEAIMGMAHALGLEVVAEGVETAGQLEFLASSAASRRRVTCSLHRYPRRRCVTGSPTVTAGKPRKSRRTRRPIGPDRQRLRSFPEDARRPRQPPGVR